MFWIYKANKSIGKSDALVGLGMHAIET